MANENRTVFDASAWTGLETKAYPKHFPHFHFNLATHWFSFTIGRMWALDAYGIELSLGRARRYTHGWTKRWVWLTAKQVFEG